MAGFLRKLLGKRPVTEQLARRGDRDAFVRALGEADIFVFAAIEGDGLDPSTLTREQLLAEIERAATDLNERQDGFAPFVYERNGRRRLLHEQRPCASVRRRVLEGTEPRLPVPDARREGFAARPTPPGVRRPRDERSHGRGSCLVEGRRGGRAADVGIAGRANRPSLDLRRQRPPSQAARRNR
jgi:hypothetical protein